MDAFPQRLHHAIPAWVKPGECFHVRIRTTPANSRALTDVGIAPALLTAVANYHERGRWFASLFLLMPDHTHALLAFPPDLGMCRVVGEWKHYTAHRFGLQWQANFFDHRLRHERERDETFSYILRNPVAKGLCATEADWPWVFRP